MLLSAVSLLVVAQLSSEIPEGLMNNPVLCLSRTLDVLSQCSVFEPVLIQLNRHQFCQTVLLPLLLRQFIGFNSGYSRFNHDKLPDSEIAPDCCNKQNYQLVAPTTFVMRSCVHHAKCIDSFV